MNMVTNALANQMLRVHLVIIVKWDSGICSHGILQVVNHVIATPTTPSPINAVKEAVNVSVRIITVASNVTVAKKMWKESIVTSAKRDFGI